MANKMQSKVYNWAVLRTLNFYETYMLPKDPKRISLLQIKQKEFQDRKKLLNPYQKNLLVQEAMGTEKSTQIKRLEKITRINTMKTFSLTYDRHEGKYPTSVGPFPDKYTPNQSILDYRNDPDWSSKMV